MSEHVFLGYVYPGGTHSELFPEIYEWFAAKPNGSFAKEVDPDEATVFMYKLDPDGLDITITVKGPAGTDGVDWPLVELVVHVTNFDDDDRDPDAPRCRTFVDLVRDLYLATERRPAMAYGASLRQGGSLPPIPGDALPETRAYLTWFDIFSPDEIEAIGRERLLSAPAPRVEELDDGSTLVCSKHPLDRDLDPLAAVADQIGIPPWISVF